ncbi:MAG: ATP-binding protein [Candidatus Micrarchaeia archaeon]|jgi:predicted AAA+ superfamily ATPase
MEDKISRYIMDRKEAIKSLKVEERLIRIPLTKDFIISLIGPRRAGKTYFLYQLIKNKKINDEDYLFVNFEEIEGSLESFISKHQEIYGKPPKFLFLDEIQSLKNWEKEVYRVFEKKKFYIFLTGSSSRFLSKEIATQLRGRSLTIKVFPFSFREILSIYGLKKEFYTSEEIGRVKNLLRAKLKEGLFPDIALKKVEASSFISEFIDLIIYRDIMERYGVKNISALEFFTKNSIASNSSVFSVNKIYNTMKSLGIKVSKNTLYNFQRFLEDVNSIFFLKKYSKSIKEVELSLPKAFVVDNSLYTFTTYKLDTGILMESFVFQELLKLGYEVNKNLYYIGDTHEVDFIILEKDRVKQLIQVTYASSKDEIKNRETNSLLKVSELLRCKNLSIITWDYEDELRINNKTIKCIPLWRWLLRYNK